MSYNYITLPERKFHPIYPHKSTPGQLWTVVSCWRKCLVLSVQI